MGSARIVLGGLLAFLAACGGSVDTAGSGDPVALPSRPAEQGVYTPPADPGLEHVADGLGAPSAIAITSDAVLFTTRSTMLGGGLVAAGGLFVASKRAGTPLMQARPTIAIDLPLKVLVWQDSEGTWLGYNDPVWIARRHGLPDDGSADLIIEAMGAIASEAATA